MNLAECMPEQIARQCPLRKLILVVSCTGLFAMLVPSAFAHELRLAYLQLNETGPDTYSVLWKIPARGDLRLSLSVQLPGRCANQLQPENVFVANTHIERRQIHCVGGLTGNTIGIEGLSEALSDVLVRIENLDGTIQVTRLVTAKSSFVVTAAPSWIQTAGTYFWLGVEHILLGIDHLLFVLALLLIVKGARRLVATVTAFTAAHSITLAAATLGFVHVQQAPVEAVIALSIVFVASEIMRVQRGQSSLTAHTPWIVAFVFGLLHGFGFAGALSEIGLPQIRIPVALLFFNVGVEFGQLFFVAAVLVLQRLLQKHGPMLPSWVKRIPPYAIGSIAMFWVFERISTF